MVQAMKSAFERLGGSNNELKGIINEIIANRSRISGFSTDEEDKQPEEAQTQTNGLNVTIDSKNSPVSFRRIIAGDTRYNPPARRHFIVGKKDPVSNKYLIVIRGSDVGPMYEYNYGDTVFFESDTQALNFLAKINNINTKMPLNNFNYKITSNGINIGSTQINDLSNCVFVETICGPAYIYKQARNCVESLQEKIVHLSNGDWQVQSEKGRNMGTYDTKKEAKKRLGQVEYFKHMNEEVSKGLEDKIRSVIAHKETDDWHDGKAYLFEVSDESKNSSNGDVDPFWIEKFDDDEVDFSKLKVYDRTPEEKEDGKYIATFMISGGKNGSGEWTDYLSQLADAFKAIKEKTGAEPLLYKIDTDIADDVWTGYVFLYDHGGNVKESLTEALAPSVKKLLTEGCWGMPYTLNDVNKLKDLMSHPVDAFEVGDCPKCKNDELGIGDDELFDRIADYRHKHKYGSKESNDIRKVIQDFIKDEVLPNWDSYSYSSPEGDYEGHTWENGVKEVFQEIADMDLKKAAKE